MTQIAFTGDLAFTKYFSKSCRDKKMLSEKIVSFLSGQIIQLSMLRVRFLRIQ